jgi:hypothetical protein
MKRVLIFFAILLLVISCVDLELSPLSEGSSENWFSNEIEATMAVNELYTSNFWYLDNDMWTDDYTYRNIVNPFIIGTLNGETSEVISLWNNCYKAIARANNVILNIENMGRNIPQSKIDKLIGNAYFVRASQYAKLISHFGDVIYFTGILDIDKAFTLSRTKKTDILESIYNDYNIAAEKLPLTYGSTENKLATRGAALAMKARIALYMRDWTVARDASKSCIDLKIYELFPDFEELFLQKTKNPKELIFGIPRSIALGVGLEDVRQYLTRNAGGFASRAPSWGLFNSFLCSDGLPIDESPLFNPQYPFKNRDPRCSNTIVEFQTPHLGFMYQPHPDSLVVKNFKTGKLQTNNDTRENNQYAPFNGLVWKKFVDDEWVSQLAENDVMIMRFADVLLMYAEAKIELNEIDQSVLDAINKVRARAYKTNFDNTASYPKIESTSQSELRTILRTERRMEFANEGLRYMDIIRWEIADKVLNMDDYGLLDPNELRAKLVNTGKWFFPMIPEIDENGTPDLTPMYNAGYCKILINRSFDPSKQYLWPIPAKEILINPNLLQNPGY